VLRGEKIGQPGDVVAVDLPLELVDAALEQEACFIGLTRSMQRERKVDLGRQCLASVPTEHVGCNGDRVVLEERRVLVPELDMEKPAESAKQAEFSHGIPEASLG
jgi:hypothetical protein